VAWRLPRVRKDPNNRERHRNDLADLRCPTVLEIASKGIEFWDYQKQTEVQFVQQSVKAIQAQGQKIEKAYSERFLELQNKTNVLVHQLKVLQEEREAEKRELHELQDKYSEKVRYVSSACQSKYPSTLDRDAPQCD